MLAFLLVLTRGTNSHMRTHVQYVLTMYYWSMELTLVFSVTVFVIKSENTRVSFVQELWNIRVYFSKHISFTHEPRSCELRLYVLKCINVFFVPY